MGELRPIQKIGGSFAREKFRWLLAVAQDPAAEYGARLAIQLAIEHLNNNTGRCDPGDDALAKSLRTNTKKIQRMRAVLIKAGHLKYELDPAGRRQGRHSNHVPLLGADQAPITGQHVSTNQTPITGQLLGECPGDLEYQLSHRRGRIDVLLIEVEVDVARLKMLDRAQ